MPALLQSIASLPNYTDAQHLDVAIVCEEFKSAVEDLEKEPGYDSACATCRLSRRILYALEESAWQDGISAAYQVRLEHADELFSRAIAQKDAVLKQIGSDQLDEVTTFFTNIAERYEELKKRAE